MILIGLILYLVGEQKIGGILMMVGAGLAVLSFLSSIGLGLLGGLA